ncbi:PITH domain protein, partial [Gregarina niphandrodes]
MIREMVEGAPTAILVQKLLDQSTPNAERRQTWLSLRSLDSPAPEVIYALGLCTLEGDLARKPEELSEFTETYNRLANASTLPGKALCVLYLIAAARPDLAVKEFPKINGESGIPEIAQVWIQFVRGCYRDALLACDDAEDFLGLRSSGEESPKYMRSLRAVCAVHAKTLNGCVDKTTFEVLNGGHKESFDEVIRSVEDGQMIIRTEFHSPLKISKISFRGGATNGPRIVRLYTNIDLPSFDEVEDIKAQQVLELTKDQVTKAERVPLRFVNFQNVKSITMFIEANLEDSESTEIQQIVLYGSQESGGLDVSAKQKHGIVGGR